MTFIPYRIKVDDLVGSEVIYNGDKNKYIIKDMYNMTEKNALLSSDYAEVLGGDGDLITLYLQSGTTMNILSEKYGGTLVVENNGNSQIVQLKKGDELYFPQDLIVDVRAPRIISDKNLLEISQYTLRGNFTIESGDDISMILSGVSDTSVYAIQPESPIVSSSQEEPEFGVYFLLSVVLVSIHNRFIKKVRITFNY